MPNKPKKNKVIRAWGLFFDDGSFWAAYFSKLTAHEELVKVPEDEMIIKEVQIKILNK